jgi:UDP:flavonoid glycosyltransferase YjiC (YdhE family)
MLFTATSGLGHLQPVLPLALAARRAGHDVLVATGGDNLSRATDLGLAGVAVGLTARERMAAYLRKWPEATTMTGAERAAFMFPHLFASAANEAIDDFVAVAESFAPDVIVSEQAELCGPAIAHARSVPNVTHGFGSTVAADRIELAAQLAVDVWDRVELDPLPLAGFYDHLYVDVYPPSLQPDELAHIPRRVLRRPESADAAPGDVLPPSVVAMTQSDAPLVYLTFGTVFNVTDAFTAAVEGLATHAVNVVVTVGPSGDPDAFGEPPPNVAIERYVPQSLLLPHVAVVASHGGSGTLLGGLAAGKPQLCMPQAADQFRNAAACERAGAGLSLVGDAATAPAIAAALHRVLHDASFAGAARRIAEEIARMPTPDDVVTVIETLAR